MSTRLFASFTSALALLVLLCSHFKPADAYNSRDPNGNITIKWDVISWTADGYVAVVTMYNFQQHRGIEAPGWTLQWTWAGKEVIWSMVGAQATEQGDCSRFRTSFPHSCKKDPRVVDLLPGTPYNQQVENCCKAGILKPNSVASFQVAVGEAGTTNTTVRLPNKFTLGAPGPRYTCGRPALQRKPTRFTSSIGRRVTHAMMTWNVICKVYLG